MDHDPTSVPKYTVEGEARTPLSPSPRNRRRWTARRSSRLRRPRHSLRIPHSLPSPPTPPSGSIMSSPRDRREGCQGSFISFSKEKETKDHTAFISSPSSSPSSSSSLSSPSPRSPPTSPAAPTRPLRLDVYIVKLPDGLIVVSLCFARPLALLASAALLCHWPKFRRIPGLLFREVDCYVVLCDHRSSRASSFFSVVAVLVKNSSGRGRISTRTISRDDRCWHKALFSAVRDKGDLHFFLLCRGFTSVRPILGCARKLT